MLGIKKGEETVEVKYLGHEPVNINMNPAQLYSGSLDNPQGFIATSAPIFFEHYFFEDPNGYVSELSINDVPKNLDDHLKVGEKALMKKSYVQIFGRIKICTGKRVENST